MSKSFKNAVRSTFDEGTLIRTGGCGGLDVMWTKYRTHTGGEYMYVMRTWEPCWMDQYTQGDTRDRIYVQRIAPKNWAVVLYGEIMGEYSDKGHAQNAAEALAIEPMDVLA